MSTITLPRRARVAAAQRTTRVAVAGCGVVGGELVRLLRAHAERKPRSSAPRFELVRVLVRDPTRPRPVELAPDVLTTDIDSFVTSGADVVIEALGGVDPAERIARASLVRGARFVTANKALVASAGATLARLARRHSSTLDFEAAVGGALPIVRILRDSLSGVSVRRIRGVLNGTTNFILSRLEAGSTFASALREAQRQGYAEADAARDLDGRDAADKIAILAWLASGMEPADVVVRRRGILPDPDRLSCDAEALGGCVRLLAECTVGPRRVTASVEPVIVRVDDEFGRTTGALNRVRIDTDWDQPITVSGPGAGGPETAAALFGDIARAASPVTAPTVSAVRPVREDGLHRWAMSADVVVQPHRLLAKLAEAGIDVERTRPGRAGRPAVTCPAPWYAIEPVVDRLDAEGARPCVARVELEERS